MPAFISHNATATLSALFSFIADPVIFLSFKSSIFPPRITALRIRSFAHVPKLKFKLSPSLAYKTQERSDVKAIPIENKMNVARNKAVFAPYISTMNPIRMGPIT